MRASLISTKGGSPVLELLVPPVLVILGAGALYLVFMAIVRMIAMVGINKGW